MNSPGRCSPGVTSCHAWVMLLPFLKVSGYFHATGFIL
jgi:hypothetical protein